MRRARSLVATALALLGSSRAALAQEFSVRNSSDDEVVLSGQLGAEQLDPGTGFKVRAADFSALSQPGEYYLEAEGIGRSVTFRIAPDVYDGELANVMLGFYGWRSGIDIAFERYGVRYEHAAGHLDDGLLDYVDGQVGVHKDGTGGWYDAGDYGKYLPTASESVGTLLVAWELFGDRLAHLSLPFIPEHGGPLPDFLSELKWELDWMLKMAYADGSGRVHHKLNSANFPGFILPAADKSKRYFSSYSTAATAELTATLAKAARAFAPYDDVTGGYSKQLLDAARLSYGFLQRTPDDVPYDNSVLKAGDYQKIDAGDRLWAAAELWDATGDPDVLADYESRQYTLEKLSPEFDWDRMRAFGVVTYALSERAGRDPAKLERARSALTEVAQQIVSNHDQNAYGRASPAYDWGSNGVIARTCVLLQSANHLSPDARYLDACADQIAYLYGRNQYNRSQVTGAGIDPPLHPHHRPSGADMLADPYPGLLVGGGQTATNWKDQQGDFSSNEVAINWSSALAFALAGFIQGEGAQESLGRPSVAAADCGVRLSSVGYVPAQVKLASVQTACGLPDTTPQCEQPASTLSGDTSGPLDLLDDVEDGDTLGLIRDGHEGSWFVYTDETPGTLGKLRAEPAGAHDSAFGICIDGGGFSDWGGGIALNLDDTGGARKPYDASLYTGISFWARGNGTPMRVLVSDTYSDPSFKICSSCYDDFQAPFTPESEWKKYTFSWSDLKQRGFGDDRPNVCARTLLALNFEWPDNTDFELCVDDVALTTAQGTVLPEPEPTGAEPQPKPPAKLRVAGGGCACAVPRAGHGSLPRETALGLGLLALAWSRRRRP